jgi:hypothetical protein
MVQAYMDTIALSAVPVWTIEQPIKDCISQSPGPKRPPYSDIPVPAVWKQDWDSTLAGITCQPPEPQGHRTLISNQEEALVRKPLDWEGSQETAHPRRGAVIVQLLSEACCQRLTYKGH